ncbi:hypothetical protein CONLIGDRAFT_414779 [Coniochaeta ligniaria NRRL 30616]|uniref:Uncharacterized protein n=1 Tax=Coniochaeta ligniaria NRRL 30616 TaxID=1408157 RepID=A0A1J7J3N9_9PEZI|nr:hypothetical protein CONLIGDRAFT_414779 [Coniochaeta ligniaria NRRL 30616]
MPARFASHKPGTVGRYPITCHSHSLSSIQLRDCPGLPDSHRDIAALVVPTTSHQPPTRDFGIPLAYQPPQNIPKPDRHLDVSHHHKINKTGRQTQRATQGHKPTIHGPADKQDSATCPSRTADVTHPRSSPVIMTRSTALPAHGFAGREAEGTLERSTITAPHPSPDHNSPSGLPPRRQLSSVTLDTGSLSRHPAPGTSVVLMTNKCCRQNTCATTGSRRPERGMRSQARVDA